MRAFLYVAIASLFVYTIKALESKQLNLALETVLNFDKKDRSADLAVIDKVQDFLEQIKNAMQGNARRNNKNELSFTDFILQASKILRNLDDNDLEEAYVIAHDESRRLINKDSDLRELFDNNNMRRYITDQLDNIKEMAADDLRGYLDSAISLIEYLKQTGENNYILDVGNTLYDGADTKLRRALKNLARLHKENPRNLKDVLKTTFESLVSHHYLDLSKIVRSRLVDLVQRYWVALSKTDHDKTATKNMDRASPTPFRHGSYKKKPRILKSIEDKSKDTEKQEIFLTGRDLKKLIHKESEENNHEESSNESNISENKKRQRPAKKKSKASYRYKHKNNKAKGKKISRTSKDKKDTDKSNEMLLMGGQVTKDFHFRARLFSDENSVEEDKKEDATSTEEIIIQHNNVIDVGLSRKIPGRLNITFITTGKDDDFVMRSNTDDKLNEKTMLYRKNIVNDTLEASEAPDRSADVKRMIENLEEQIEAVKDQIAYIKSYAQAQSKINNINAVSNKTENATVTEERPMSFLFRAQYDFETENNTSTTVAPTNSFGTIETTKIFQEEDNNDELFYDTKTKSTLAANIIHKDISNVTASQGNLTEVNINSTIANLVDTA